MNQRLKLLIATFIFTVASCLAQPAQTTPFSMKDDGLWQKASTTHRLSQFPKIHKDGSVWFRFKAPQTAQSVKLHFYSKDYEMIKDTSGLWNIILKNPQPGYQVYWMIVDGAVVQDPGSDMFYSNGYTSVLEVPAPESEFYSPGNVPHGEVREHWFYSKVTGSYRRMFVYTPPNYDKNINTKYPVLYLQHGAGELENEWTHSGKMNFILDNLIAEGKALPMIVVMNNGFATRAITGRAATYRKRKMGSIRRHAYY